MGKPILVLQMQRMGDLILSFPLLGILQNIYADHPIWTVAEEQFSSQLMTMAPQTVFFAPSAAPGLIHQDYKAVINLSHRPDAALLAGKVQAEERYGAYTQHGTTFLGGDWALYRASIVHNNRYNLFHWSDLYLLDHIRNAKIPPWNVNTAPQPTDNTIGIFVGASETEKRPSVAHYAKLAALLSRKGYKTLLLGGPSDVDYGLEIEKLSKLTGASLCGRFTVEQLALVLQKLSLFITPDTGPMHLAAWVNTPIINLSLGPVNPWETGPHGSMHTQHYVVQPKVPCAGCWQACKNIQHCHEKLRPEHIAHVVHKVLQGQKKDSQKDSLEDFALPQLEIYRTSQDINGLFTLLSCKKTELPSSREVLSLFWKQWFWHRLQNRPSHETHAQEAFSTLRATYPHLAQNLQKSIIQLGKSFRQELKNTLIHKKQTLTCDFWKTFPEVIHPFSSYAYLYLQNNGYALHAWEEVINQIECLYNTTQ